jgi:heme/copper-type cytochrome/quinol oxidase subunit 4
MKKKKDKRSLFPYVAFVIRICFGLFAMAVAVIFFLRLTDSATDRFSYALSYLIPVMAAVIVFGDIYMHWKLDIRPLREAKRDRKKNPAG